jgi:hypothetical protein
VVLTALGSPFFLGALTRKTPLVHTRFAVPLLMIKNLQKNPSSEEKKIRKSIQASFSSTMQLQCAVESSCFLDKAKQRIILSNPSFYNLYLSNPSLFFWAELLLLREQIKQRSVSSILLKYSFYKY